MKKPEASSDVKTYFIISESNEELQDVKTYVIISESNEKLQDLYRSSLTKTCKPERLRDTVIS